MRILLLNGPNLSTLGRRQPDVYGSTTLAEIVESARAHALARGSLLDAFQSNHEGALIDRLHERDFEVAIVNAAGLTHTSVALRDALLGIARPFWEVHLSDPATREPFRQMNFLTDVARSSIVGRGMAGYLDALEEIAAASTTGTETGSA
jgi:3-dehydroquinate dehydratase-2